MAKRKISACSAQEQVFTSMDNTRQATFPGTFDIQFPKFFYYRYTTIFACPWYISKDLCNFDALLTCYGCYMAHIKCMSFGMSSSRYNTKETNWFFSYVLQRYTYINMRIFVFFKQGIKLTFFFLKYYYYSILLTRNF